LPVNTLETFTLSPNPSQGVITIKIKLLQMKSVSFRIFDEYGRLVYESARVNVSGNTTKQIGLRGKAQGNYYLQTIVGPDTFVKKNNHS
jgi:hypothetical protein